MRNGICERCGASGPVRGLAWDANSALWCEPCNLECPAYLCGYENCDNPTVLPLMQAPHYHGHEPSQDELLHMLYAAFDDYESRVAPLTAWAAYEIVRDELKGTY